MREFLERMLKDEAIKNEIIDILSNESKSNLVPFSTGTDEEIMSIVNRYYSGELSLKEIQSIWNIGDEREITLANDDKIKVVIIGFNHDNLSNHFNNKALITLQIKDIEYKAPMIYTLKDEYNWKNSGARKWCDIFFEYLPSIYKENIQSTLKYTYKSKFTEDKCFLLSEKEVFGKIIFSNEKEDFYNKQYEYYKEKNNRIKNTFWWLRSPYASDSGYFCSVGDGGNAGYYYASYARGLAPAFCL